MGNVSPLTSQDALPNSLVISKAKGKLPRIEIDFCDKVLEHQKVLMAISDKSKRIMREREELAIANQAMGQNSGKRVEETLTHTKRIAIIYLSQVHGISIRKTAAMMQSHYSTVRSVMEAYKESGRTNKLLTYQSKSLILKQR